MRKVEIAVMKPWIAKKVIELLGFEDDVLIEYINSLLEDPDNPVRSFNSYLLKIDTDQVLSTERRLSTQRTFKSC
jgi:hypothetical protein